MQKKGSSIVWNHQHADPEFGAMQARELQYHLQGVLTAFPVAVRVGKGYVEACPKGINKGVMAERFISSALSSPGARRPFRAGEEERAADAGGGSSGGSGISAPLDFVLCIGDDSSDELMFQALHGKLGNKPGHMDLYTATVGRKPFEAQAYLGDHSEVVELLKMFASVGAATAQVRLDGGPRQAGRGVGRRGRRLAGAERRNEGAGPWWARRERRPWRAGGSLAHRPATRRIRRRADGHGGGRWRARRRRAARDAAAVPRGAADAQEWMKPRTQSFIG